MPKLVATKPTDQVEHVLDIHPLGLPDEHRRRIFPSAGRSAQDGVVWRTLRILQEVAFGDTADAFGTEQCLLHGFVSAQAPPALAASTDGQHRRPAHGRPVEPQDLTSQCDFTAGMTTSTGCVECTQVYTGRFLRVSHS